MLPAVLNVHAMRCVSVSLQKGYVCGLYGCVIPLFLELNAGYSLLLLLDWLDMHVVCESRGEQTANGSPFCFC